MSDREKQQKRHDLLILLGENKMGVEHKLTKKQIDAAVKDRRFDEQTIEIAKCVMADGWPAAKASEHFGVNRARVYAIRDKVWAAYVESSMYPPSWKEVTLMASPELIEKFTTLAEKERQKWLTSK
jgi:hypothetical protein